MALTIFPKSKLYRMPLMFIYLHPFSIRSERPSKTPIGTALRYPKIFHVKLISLWQCISRQLSISLLVDLIWWKLGGMFIWRGFGQSHTQNDIRIKSLSRQSDDSVDVSTFIYSSMIHRFPVITFNRMLNYFSQAPFCSTFGAHASVNTFSGTL